MADRAGLTNPERFPHREDADGNPLCRMCQGALTGRRTSFCGPRCVRDFYMKTCWDRVRRVVYERDGGICMLCGTVVNEDSFHVDHIRPLAKGGNEWDLANLQLACPPCNLSKGGR